ncbi:MAG: ABC transporter permease [Propionibacteriaceae bacterium]
MTTPTRGVALDLTPAPGAAPAGRRVLRHAAIEVRLLLRNGEQLLLALVIPVGILVLGHVLGRFGSLRTLVPSVLALALWSSAFTSVAIATGFERRYGVLERLASTPLGRSGLILGKAVAVVIVAVGQLVVLSGVGLVLGWRPALTSIDTLGVVLAVVLAIVTFTCCALALAGRLPAETTLAVANLIYVVLAAGGALVVPVASYPGALAEVVRWLPTAALGEALRGWSVGQLLGWPLAVLAGWSVIGGLLAWKGHRWMS